MFPKLSLRDQWANNTNSQGFAKSSTPNMQHLGRGNKVCAKIITK